MRKLVRIPSNACHCRSVRVFCVAYGFARLKVLPQSFETAEVKLSWFYIFCRPV